jgi:hypothetical protein
MVERLKHDQTSREWLSEMRREVIDQTTRTPPPKP